MPRRRSTRDHDRWSLPRDRTRRRIVADRVRRVRNPRHNDRNQVASGQIAASIDTSWVTAPVRGGASQCAVTIDVLPKSPGMAGLGGRARGAQPATSAGGAL
jgi:hypothetical protein